MSNPSLYGGRLFALALLLGFSALSLPAQAWAARTLPATVTQTADMVVRLEGGALEEKDGALFLTEGGSSTLRVELPALEMNQRMRITVQALLGDLRLRCVAGRSNCVVRAGGREASYIQEAQLARALTVMSLADDIRVEDTEAAQLRVSGVAPLSGLRAATQTLDFSVPRHGYLVRAVWMQTPSPVYRTAPLVIEVVLNRLASSDADVFLLVQNNKFLQAPPDERAGTIGRITVPAGKKMARARFPLAQSRFRGNHLNEGPFNVYSLQDMIRKEGAAWTEREHNLAGPLPVSGFADGVGELSVVQGALRTWIERVRGNLSTPGFSLKYAWSQFTVWPPLLTEEHLDLSWAPSTRAASSGNIVRLDIALRRPLLSGYSDWRMEPFSRDASVFTPSVRQCFNLQNTVDNTAPRCAMIFTAADPQSSALRREVETGVQISAVIDSESRRHILYEVRATATRVRSGYRTAFLEILTPRIRRELPVPMRLHLNGPAPDSGGPAGNAVNAVWEVRSHSRRANYFRGGIVTDNIRYDAGRRSADFLFPPFRDTAAGFVSNFLCRSSETYGTL